MDAVRDSGQADVLEIEVTPEMAHAGAMMLLSWDDMPVYPPGEYLLNKTAELYREMTKARIVR